MHLRILAVFCVFNVMSLQIPSQVKNLALNSKVLTKLSPLNDLSSLAETLVQADPAAVQEIIDLLLQLKNDSVTMEQNLENEVANAYDAKENAKDVYNAAVVAHEEAQQALTEAQRVEAICQTNLTAAELTQSQAEANLQYQKPLLDSDQRTIDVVIGLLQNMTITSSPTSSPTTSPTTTASLSSPISSPSTTASL